MNCHPNNFPLLDKIGARSIINESIISLGLPLKKSKVAMVGSVGKENICIRELPFEAPESLPRTIFTEKNPVACQDNAIGRKILFDVCIHVPSQSKKKMAFENFFCIAHIPSETSKTELLSIQKAIESCARKTGIFFLQCGRSFLGEGKSFPPLVWKQSLGTFK
jgi:hypothetical protein